MAAPRLPFLWPMLFRPRQCYRQFSRAAIHDRQLNRGFVTTTRNAEPPPPQRYGTAQEPDPHLREEQERKERERKQLETKKVTQLPPEEEEDEEPPPTIRSSTRAPLSNEDDSGPTSPLPEPPRTGDSKPLETVLHMPSPSEEDSRRPPHMKATPYVHHFDTYSLVKQLCKGGYTTEQAITTMKAVRGILTENIELARKSLVSKSNVENETYLFRAACSELRTEVENNRKGEIEKMRSERNQLQHELDILTQKLGQETSHLKDELKGLFDDRKMAVRQEQSAMDSKIQELNYKITINLNSDARSEIEALRWILTRRAAITIGASAFMLFLMLRYSSYVAHNNAEEKKKAKEKTPPPPPPEGENKPPPVNPQGDTQDALGGELLAASGVSLG